MKKHDKQAIKWEWRDGFRPAVDPEVVGQELELLSSRLGTPVDGLAPEHVLESAQSQDSPLHDLFDWDDEHAANQHRLEQARRVLRGLGYRIVDSGEKKIHIGRVAINVENHGRLYVPVREAVLRQNLREQMIADAIRGLEGWKSRYEELSSLSRELSKAFKLADRLIDELKIASDKAAPVAAAR